MPGRVNSVAVSADGKRIAAGSSLDGAGEVDVYALRVRHRLARQHQGDHAEGRHRRGPAEKRRRSRSTIKDGVQLISPGQPAAKAGVYAVAFRPDGKVLAAAGCRRHRPADQPGDRLGDQGVRPRPGRRAASPASGRRSPSPRGQEEAVETETLPAGASVVVAGGPAPRVKLDDRSPTPSSSSPAGSTRARRSTSPGWSRPGRLGRVAEVSPVGPGPAAGRRPGLARPPLGGPVGRGPGRRSRAMTRAAKVDFVHDVTPVLSRLGCNAGTCHGSAQGKNGFKLSLRGYDPIFDVRALTDDHGRPAGQPRLARRQPDAAQAHRRRAARRRPADAAGRAVLRDPPRLDRRRREARPTSPKVAKIEVSPVNPVVQRVGPKQQLRVLATYADGEVRDVTREAFLESGNTEVATANRSGLMTAAPPRRGPDPRPLRGELRRDHADRHGRPDRLRLGAAPDLQQDRRAGRRQVAADEDPALGPLHRRRVPPPRLPRPDRPAPDGRRRPRVPRRRARDPRQAGRAGRPADRQPRVRRLLDEQVGRPAPGQPQVPRRRGVGRLPQLDPRPGRGEHALRPVRPRRS